MGHTSVDKRSISFLREGGRSSEDLSKRNVKVNQLLRLV